MTDEDRRIAARRDGLATSDRVPTVGSSVVYDPPITVEELMLRLHRPGLGDRRTPYEVRVNLEFNARVNPEDRSAVPGDVSTRARAEIYEVRPPGSSAQYKHDLVALAWFVEDAGEKLLVRSVEPSSGARWNDAYRLWLLASTPLRSPDAATPRPAKAGDRSVDEG